MYEHNQHTDNISNSTKIDKKFLDALYEFIHSVKFELDIMLPGFASLRFLAYYKIIDYIISQKLSKNIIIRMLCPLDEDNGKLTKRTEEASSVCCSSGGGLPVQNISNM